MKNTSNPTIRKAEPVSALASIMVVQMRVDELRAVIADAVEPLHDALAARPPKTLLDGSGICQLLGVTPPTIRKLREDGCPFMRVGESYRYDGDAVLEWLRQRTDGSR